MIPELKKLSYRYEEQKVVYNKYSSELSNKDKYELVYSYLENGHFWSYQQLICDISLEIAENSEEFIALLFSLEKKVRGDMGQKPFIDLLFELGKKKFGLELYNNIILNKNFEEQFKIIVGLVLGKYAIQNEEILLKRLLEPIEFPLTNSYLKAILVFYEEKVLDSNLKEYFEKIMNLKDYRILIELAFVSLKFYEKDTIYFSNLIKKLLVLNNGDINWVIFNRLTYDEKFGIDEFFDLVEIAKDFDIKIIDLIVEKFRKYPQEEIRIMNYFIYWLNKVNNFDFNSHNFRWVLEELVKQNKRFISLFFERYIEIKPEKKEYYYLFPPLFEILSKYHFELVLDEISKISLNNIRFFCELGKKFIGNLYKNNANLEIIVKFNEILIELVKKRRFISFNLNNYNNKLASIKKKSEISKEDYDYLIDISNDLISQLRDRKEKYDFELINTNLSKYSTLNKFTSQILNSFQKNGIFSPLLWLGENEVPNLENLTTREEKDDLKRALQLSYIRSLFWPRAYLYELNSGLEKYLKFGNDKSGDSSKRILNDLPHEKSFWSLESELIFINRFSDSVIKILEPKVPNRSENNFDLKINLFNREIYFDIVRPEITRDLKLGNGASFIRNKAFGIIDTKFKQIMSETTLKEIKSQNRKDLFFVVIDISNSTIGEFEINDALYGTSQYTFLLDKNTREEITSYPSRKDDSIHKRNPNTDIITGVIYFKQDLVINSETESHINLSGGILLNQNALNSLSEQELTELKEIIFGQ